MTTPIFRDNWLDADNWPAFLGPYIGQPRVRALEVGTYEGMGATWLLDNVLTGAYSVIHCVDLFKSPGGRIRPDYEIYFDRNMSRHITTGRAVKYKGSSDQILRRLEYASYDIIYLDASHFADEVLEGAVLCWRLLKPGGILIFDDYRWGGTDMSPEELPATGIDGFLAAYRQQYEILHQGYQAIIRKNVNLREYFLSLCPACQRAIRFPYGKTINVCPYCGVDFWSQHED